MRAFFLCASVLALCGCETLAYYGQAASGQLALVHRARPVEEILADRSAAPALRAKLERAREIREFAVRELALPADGAFTRYAELDRPYAVWNVVAAPEFSLEPVQSCFPVAGCVAYRGYFERAAGERHAASRRAAGYDAVVYGVPAYSTLGWFDDPLLSTFIDYPEAELARLVFHELAHQVVYVKDDSTFNESFAVTVEREGLRRWAEAKARPVPARGAREELRARIESARLELEALYASGMAPDEMRRRKQDALQPLQAWVARLPGFENQAANNAFLALFATYTEKVPAFERLLAEAEGDLARFYARVKALARLPRAERDAALR
jgi:predicted aminopeptidase